MTALEESILAFLPRDHGKRLRAELEAEAFKRWKARNWRVELALTALAVSGWVVVEGSGVHCTVRRRAPEEIVCLPRRA